MKKTILSLFLSLVMVPWAFAAPATTEGKEEHMLQLGAAAPDFLLPEVVFQEQVALKEFNDKKALLVISMCRHCPFVKRVIGGIAQLGKDYAGKDIAIVGISTNDAETYADDSPAGLKEMVEQAGIPFPVLYDETQKVGAAYTFVATPDFLLFDQNRNLVYRGQMDGARPGNDVPNDGKDIRAAIDAVLADQPVPTDQKPAMGCSIKWKDGNEPAYLNNPF